MARGKKAGKISQSANDFLEPKAPVISSVTNVGTDRPFGNGAVVVSFDLPADSPAATSYTASGYCSVHSTTHTATGASSPLTITGFGSNITSPITVVATNSVGSSPASASVTSPTITTVPDTIPTPSASNNGAQNNTASWSTPSDGGTAIIDYYVEDNGGGGDENKTVAVGTNSVSFANQNNDFVWNFRVRARNANGNGAFSNYSGTVTTTAFSFAPFGFTPFGFTPFGFTPFGFTPFGFTPGKSIGADTLIHSKVPEGLVLAHNVSAGDILYSAAIDDLPMDGVGLEEIIESWSSAAPQINTDIETTVVSISANIAMTTYVINGNKYTNTHWVLTKRDGVARFISANEIVETDLIYSPTFSDWQPIIELRVSEGPELVITINTEPYDVFFTDNSLVHDSVRLDITSPNVITEPNQSVSESLEVLYQQWKDSTAGDTDPTPEA
jgi:hypothetical protein